MQYVILDLEWNVTFSKKKKKYFNEIIEVGAVRLKEDRTLDNTFQAYVGAQISKKLCSKVAELTNLEFSDIENGQPFSAIAKTLRLRGHQEKLVQTAVNRLGKKEIQAAMQQTAQIDKIIKGLRSESWMDDAWDALTQLGLSLART